MYYAMLIKQNCYRLMAIFVSFQKNPDWLEKAKEAPVYQQHFSAAPLPHQLRLVRNLLGLEIQVQSRSGKHIIRGAWNCFIGLSESEKGDTTMYIVDAEESSDSSTAPPRHYGLRQQAPF
jgi:uncharacterized protein YicC (UPF0701 family)